MLDRYGELAIYRIYYTLYIPLVNILLLGILWFRHAVAESYLDTRGCHTLVLGIVDIIWELLLSCYYSYSIAYVS